jgi:hypothetical protein
MLYKSITYKKAIGINHLGPMYIKYKTGYNGFILIKERAKL